MFLNHVALVCGSEDNSDRFYQGVLGLAKTGSKRLSSALSSQIFGLDDEYKLVVYEKDGVKFEIFISDGHVLPKKDLAHVCIEVENRTMFLQNCTAAGVEKIEIPRGETTLVFIKDFDGNQFEVKEKN